MEVPASSTHAHAHAHTHAHAQARARALSARRFIDVENFLRSGVGRTFTAAEVKAATGHDVLADADLVLRLREATSVRMRESESDSDGVARDARLRFVPVNRGVDGAASLLNFVRDQPTGTFREELEECYAKASDDIDQLVRDGAILCIHHPCPPEIRRATGTVFPAAQGVLFPAERMGVSLDADIVLRFLSTPVPADAAELEATVRRLEMTSGLSIAAAQESPGLAAGSDSSLLTSQTSKRMKNNKNRAFDVSKATNKHLPGLFDASS